MNLENGHHSLHSAYREMLLEHLFLGEVMRYVWRSGIKRLEILKPQVDDGGYDLVLEANSIVRHVQLKGTFRGSKVQKWSVNLGLASKPSGCVVVLLFDKESLELGPFLWFGGKPGDKLPDLLGYRPGRHTKGNAKGKKGDRPRLRSVPRSVFTKVGSIPEIAAKLFGELPEGGPAASGSPASPPVSPTGTGPTRTTRTIEKAVRKVKAHCSWHMLRDGCLDLLGRPQTFSTPRVRASARAFARRAAKATDFDFQQLLEWLSSTDLVQ